MKICLNRLFIASFLALSVFTSFAQAVEYVHVYADRVVYASDAVPLAYETGNSSVGQVVDDIKAYKNERSLNFNYYYEWGILEDSNSSDECFGAEGITFINELPKRYCQHYKRRSRQDNEVVHEGYYGVAVFHLCLVDFPHFARVNYYPGGRRLLRTEGGASYYEKTCTIYCNKLGAYPTDPYYDQCGFTGPPPFYCPQGYSLNRTTHQCEARCAAGSTWNNAIYQCITNQAPQNCSTQSVNPIGFANGRKYRTEAIISVGGTFPIELKYYYNSHLGNERTLAGFVSADMTSKVVHTVEPMIASEYETKYPESKSRSIFYEPVQRYWRHNYEHMLQPKYSDSSIFVWERPQGESVELSPFGQASRLYPDIRFESMSFTEIDELGFSGHKIVWQNRIYWFDEIGRLKRLAPTSSSQYHTIDYHNIQGSIRNHIVKYIVTIQHTY